MRVIQVTATAGPDGVLRLEIPGAGAAYQYDAVVVPNLKPPARVFPHGYKPTPEELGWPPGFLEKTAGSIDDDSFTVHPQPPVPPPLGPLD